MSRRGGRERGAADARSPRDASSSARPGVGPTRAQSPLTGLSGTARRAESGRGPSPGNSPRERLCRVCRRPLAAPIGPGRPPVTCSPVCAAAAERRRDNLRDDRASIAAWEQRQAEELEHPLAWPRRTHLEMLRAIEAQLAWLRARHARLLAQPAAAWLDESPAAIQARWTSADADAPGRPLRLGGRAPARLPTTRPPSTPAAGAPPDDR